MSAQFLFHAKGSDAANYGVKVADLTDLHNGTTLIVLRLTDGEGTAISLYFDSVQQVREFGQKIVDGADGA